MSTASLPGMTPKQTLLAHLREHHPRFERDGKTGWTLDKLQHWHIEQHWRYGSRSHYHAGPNEGPWLRPPGWKTGEDVVMR